MPKFSSPFRITYTGLPRLPKRFQNEIVGKTMRHIAFLWWRDYRPIHFTPQGARKYHYGRRRTKDIFTGQPRRDKKTKRPMAPSGRPIHWFGDTERESKNKRIGGTSNKSYVTMQMRNLNRYKPKKAKYKLADEVRVVLKQEIKELEIAGKKDLERRLQQYGTRHTVTIRG